jgi:hypothetical protein
MNFYRVNELENQTEIAKLEDGGNTTKLYIKDGDALPDLDEEYILLKSTDTKLLLPEKIYVYGKGHGINDALYVNKWHPIWQKTIKEGFLTFYEPYQNRNALQIGFGYEFRQYKGFWRLYALLDWLYLLFNKKIDRVED